MIDSALIESVMRTHPYVDDCAVRLRRTEDGLPRVVAYVQCRGRWDPDTLRSYLESRLPTPFLPSDWVQIARMPLTADGRPDDQALRELPVVDCELVRRCEEFVNAKV